MVPVSQSRWSCGWRRASGGCGKPRSSRVEADGDRRAPARGRATASGRDADGNAATSGNAGGHGGCSIDATASGAGHARPAAGRCRCRCAWSARNQAAADRRRTAQKSRAGSGASGARGCSRPRAGRAAAATRGRHRSQRRLHRRPQRQPTPVMPIARFGGVKVVANEGGRNRERDVILQFEGDELVVVATDGRTRIRGAAPMGRLARSSTSGRGAGPCSFRRRATSQARCRRRGGSAAPGQQQSRQGAGDVVRAHRQEGRVARRSPALRSRSRLGRGLRPRRRRSR